jgi:hypothetical protein
MENFNERIFRKTVKGVAVCVQQSSHFLTSNSHQLKGIFIMPETKLQKQQPRALNLQKKQIHEKILAC